MIKKILVFTFVSCAVCSAAILPLEEESQTVNPAFEIETVHPDLSDKSIGIIKAIEDHTASLIEKCKNRLSALNAVVVDYKKNLKTDLQKLKNELDSELEEIQNHNEKLYQDSKNNLEKYFNDGHNDLQQKLWSIVNNMKKINEGVFELDLIFQSNLSLKSSRNVN